MINGYFVNIQKTMHISYSLKHYFSSFSDEFSRFDYMKKMIF